VIFKLSNDHLLAIISKDKIILVEVNDRPTLIISNNDVNEFSDDADLMLNAIPSMLLPWRFMADS